MSDLRDAQPTEVDVPLLASPPPDNGLPPGLVDGWRRYRGLDNRLQAAIALGAVAALYAIFYNLPGSGPWLSDKAPFGIIVLGLVLGAITAFDAVGLILIYRANRFINFAYAAPGAMVGMIGVGLITVHHWSYWTVFPLAIAAGILVGGLVELIVIRRFWNSSRLVLTVASIGLAQLLGGMGFLIAKQIGFIGLTGGFSSPITWEFNLGPATFHGDQVLILLVVPWVLIGLGWFLLKTDSGMAVRAAAENSDRALLLGIPIRRLSTLVWMIAGGLATLAFILKAPSAGVNPAAAQGVAATALLPGLAAAVLARMESMPVAVAAGLALGVMEQLVQWNSSSPTFVWVMYLLVILVALLAQRGKLSRAFDGSGSSWSSIGNVKPIPRELRRLPEVRIGRGVVIVLTVAALIWVPATWSASNQLLAAIAIVWAMVAVSLVVLTGWAGNISLGQFAIVGVGAAVAGKLVMDHNLDFFLVMLVAAAVGALLSLLVGLPALRIRGLFLAVTTLALAEAFNDYFLNPVNSFGSLKFDRLIPNDVNRPVIWNRFDMAGNYTAYLVCLAFLFIAIGAARGVRKARGGRVLIATRDNERAASSASVSTSTAKLVGFVMSGAIAGAGGGLYVLLLNQLGSGSVPSADSLSVFSYAVIGGLGSIAGALAGVFFFKYLETVHALGDLRNFITGFVLLIVLYVIPGGIGQIIFNVRDRLLRYVAQRRGIVVPSLLADRRDDDEGVVRGAADEVSMLAGALAAEPPARAPRGAPPPPPPPPPASEAERETVGAGKPSAPR
ncbi:MAG TPA: ABC transporter permease [Acidimicrobiales bacterium]|nr:ABC transporter permease [Acidimicrobiales bacterium]